MSSLRLQLKHDGFRALAHIGDGRCNLISERTMHTKVLVRCAKVLLGCACVKSYVVGHIRFLLWRPSLCGADFDRRASHVQFCRKRHIIRKWAPV
jgi:hypothetical protein